MGRVLLDLRCDNCEHIIEDEYAEGGQGFYGTCGKCGEGIMRQIFSTGGFTLGTIANISGTTGRTSNGTKYEVVGRPRKYCYKTGKWGGEVL